MPTAEEIKHRIENAITGARAEVEDYTGSGDHFRATVVSPMFAKRSRIEQHKLVYDVFGDEIGGAIHALSLKTRAAQEPSDFDVVEQQTSDVVGKAGTGDEQHTTAAI